MQLEQKTMILKLQCQTFRVILFIWSLLQFPPNPIVVYFLCEFVFSVHLSVQILSVFTSKIKPIFPCSLNSYYEVLRWATDAIWKNIT